MILEGDFYTFSQPKRDGERISATININADHSIFKGHFPGQPVVPGVCMMQMVKELLETNLHKTFRLKEGHDLKFLSVIDPTRNNRVNAEASFAELSNGKLTVTARLFHNETTFFKFKGVFQG